MLLAPYIDRVTLTGPDVFLEPDPSFALSSAVHELATNASKYGSLSDEAGRLDLDWSVDRARRACGSPSTGKSAAARRRSVRGASGSARA